MKTHLTIQDEHDIQDIIKALRQVLVEDENPLAQLQQASLKASALFSRVFKREVDK